LCNACYIGLHARGELHCDSHPECSLAILDLSRFLFFQKLHHSAAVTCLYSSFVFLCFIALHRMFQWQIYRTEMGNQNLDMLLDILPNQDNAFRRYSSTPTFSISTLPLC
ncbi:hypothetical protein BAE44_0020999, partial [Dichanthelium oligosanthes]